MIPFPRPLSIVHKNLLKVHLLINTQNSEMYLIGKVLVKQLRQLKTSGTSFIRDSKVFVDNTKNEKQNKHKKLFSFDINNISPSLSKDEVLTEVKRRIKKSSFLTNTNKSFLTELAS